MKEIGIKAVIPANIALHAGDWSRRSDRRSNGKLLARSTAASGPVDGKIQEARSPARLSTIAARSIWSWTAACSTRTEVNRQVQTPQTLIFLDDFRWLLGPATSCIEQGPPETAGPVKFRPAAIERIPPCFPTNSTAMVSPSALSTSKNTLQTSLAGVIP